jgi:hypothetical protein
MSIYQGFTQEVRKRVELFSFFHLGSDAEVTFRERTQELMVAISHRRVHPFVFTLGAEQLRSFASDPAALEDFLLDHLTRYRRS